MAAFLVITMSSCNTEAESATLRIELKSSRRTIEPEEDYEIYGYRITAISPDGKESDPHYTYYSYMNLDGLCIGEWKIKVYGFNSDRNDLSYGEGKISLVTGKNTISIALTELVGEGDLSVTLDWRDANLEDVKEIRTVFKNQQGEAIKLSPTTPSNGRSMIIHSGLPSGSYTLQVELLDGEGKKLHGLAEAIRISNKSVTKAEIVFPGISLPEKGDAGITISDRTSTPVEVEITGIESLIEADRPFTTAVEIPSDSSVEVKDLSVVWLLDGVEIGRGSTWTFSEGVAEGWHRIDVMTDTGEEGSVGSSSYIFQAALSTKEGDPYQKITITNGEDFVLGEESVMHFLPNNLLLIFSNFYRTVQLVSIENRNAKVCAEYSYSELNIDDNYTVADFASSGSAEDAYYSVIALANSSSSCIAYNLIVSKNQISQIDEETSFDASQSSSRACRFVNITEGKNIFVATIENKTKTRMGYVLFNINPGEGNMVNRECYIYDPKTELGYSGFQALSSLPDTGFTISISAQRGRVIKAAFRNGSKFSSYSDYRMWKSFEEYVEAYDRNETLDEFSGGYGCGFLTSDGTYAFVLAKDGIVYYRLDGPYSADDYTQYAIKELPSSSIGAIEMCSDVRYGYMIDNEKRDLVTLQIAQGDDGNYYLNEGTRIALESSSCDTITISKDGRYLAVYDSAQCRNVMFIKASR